MADKFDTRLIHGGTPNSSGPGVSPSIEMSTTFVRSNPKDQTELIYSRHGNPNRTLLESRIASIEKGFDALAFASGSATSFAMFQALPSQSHIIVTRDAYFGTVLQLNELVTNMGHTVDAVDTTSLDQIEKRINSRTRLIWIETPSNPLMRISDINAITQLAQAKNILVCCDNTLASSALQQPLELGADFSMHSSTKFFSGHSDVTGGVVIAKHDSPYWQKLKQIQKVGGAVPAPMDCWLLTRSIATLGLRVRQQSANAAILCQRLSEHQQIEKVLYAGNSDHPQKKLIDSQMSAGGSMFSVLVKGGAERALQIAASTRLFKQATSLGGVESLIEHRHSVEGETTLSPENLLRISTGVEDVEDLYQDLTNAIG